MNLDQRYLNQGYDIYLALPISVYRKHTVALLDTGAARSFISTTFVHKANIPIQKKKHSYKLTIATGEKISEEGIVNETVPVRIAIQQHNEVASFDIFEIATHDFILGMPWLKKHNPVVDWKNKQLRFRDSLTIKAWTPGKSRGEATDKKTHKAY